MRRTISKTGAQCAGFLLLFLMLASCRAVPVNPKCVDKKSPCALGTQKVCDKHSQPCECRCQSLNSDPYAPKGIDDPDRIGFPKEEKPSSHETEGPFD